MPLAGMSTLLGARICSSQYRAWAKTNHSGSKFFANGGRLLALKKSDTEGRDGGKAKQTLSSTVAELGNGLPSMAAGFGLIYAHPVARFELNFSLPLVLRKGEEGRKGLQFGIGINML